ncbi:MAG: Vitamin K epoxide reductase family protein [Microgenomates bacterium OLB22]|nr:MAG: Vitamin K epoxide reductase family protein [Microgenomates bacterium OLB22]
MSLSKINTVIQVLAAFGIMLAIYLLWQQIAMPAFTPCSISAQVNCDAVISGPLSKILGIPTPLIGLVGYVVILLAAITGKTKLIVAAATGGLVFCLSLAYIELFQLRVICPVCIMCQVIMIIVWISSIVLLKNEQRTIS